MTSIKRPPRTLRDDRDQKMNIYFYGNTTQAEVKQHSQVADILACYHDRVANFLFIFLMFIRIKLDV